MEDLIKFEDNFSIDKSNRLPFYYQLKLHYIKMIESGNWKAGQKLPYANDICNILDISKIVVKQCYQELKSEGYIESTKGKGTFVAEPKIYTNWVQNFMGFNESMKGLGYSTESTVLRQEKITADDKIASLLMLKSDKNVVLLERIHNINGDPFSFSIDYLPYKMFPELINTDLRYASLYKTLMDNYGINITHGKRFIEIEKSSGKVAKFLNIKKGNIVFKIESISYLEDNTPFEYFVSFHIGEKTKFVVEMIKKESYGIEPQLPADPSSSGVFIVPSDLRK